MYIASIAFFNRKYDEKTNDKIRKLINDIATKYRLIHSSTTSGGGIEQMEFENENQDLLKKFIYNIQITDIYSQIGDPANTFVYSTDEDDEDELV